VQTQKNPPFFAAGIGKILFSAKNLAPPLSSGAPFFAALCLLWLRAKDPIEDGLKAKGEDCKAKGCHDTQAEKHIERIRRDIPFGEFPPAKRLRVIVVANLNYGSACFYHR
jgi:hypothetical protein